MIWRRIKTGKGRYVFDDNNYGVQQLMYVVAEGETATEQPVEWYDEIDNYKEAGFMWPMGVFDDGTIYTPCFSSEINYDFAGETRNVEFWKISPDGAAQPAFSEELDGRFISVENVIYGSPDRILVFHYNYPNEDDEENESYWDRYESVLVDTVSGEEVPLEVNFARGYADHVIYDYDPVTGEPVDTGDYFRSVIIGGGAVFGMKVSGEVVAVSAEDGRLLDETVSLGEDWAHTQLIHADADYIWYLNEQGVCRIPRGGVLSEVVLDASRFEFGSPDAEVVEVVMTPENDIAMLLSFNPTFRDGLKHRLVRYSYDSELILQPVRELSIFAMADSAYLNKVVDVYHRNNRDVAVNYEVLDRYNDNYYGIQVITPEEYLAQKVETLAALQKELDAGRGPDILILDAETMRSFGEAGLLYDLYGAIGPEYIDPAFLNVMTDDSGTYAIPADVSIPILAGKSETIRSVQSLEDLLQYFEVRGKTNSKGLDYYAVFDSAYSSFASAITTDDINGFDRVAASDFLTTVKRMTDALEPFNNGSPEDTHSAYGTMHNFKHGSYYTTAEFYSEGGYGMKPPDLCCFLSNSFISSIVGGLYRYQADNYASGRWVVNDENNAVSLMPGYQDGCYIIQTALAVGKNTEVADDAIRFIEYYHGDEVDIHERMIPTALRAAKAQQLIDALDEGAFNFYDYPPIDFDVEREIYSKLNTPVIIDSEILEVFCFNAYRYCYEDVSLDAVLRDIEANIKELR